MYAGIMSVKMSESTIRVHCRVVCSAALVCPPGRSQAHRPRGPLSPTATSADSASGSPARCCRTGLIPGLSSPVGRPCVGEALFFKFKHQETDSGGGGGPRAKISSTLSSPC